MKTMKVKLTFLESILGTAPNNEEIYTEFIGSKAEDALSLEEEVNALGADAVTEKGTTVFPRDEQGNPIIWSYQIEGFFKSACGFLWKIPGTKSSKVKAYRKTIDGLIFVESPDIDANNPTGRKIKIEGAFPMGVLERPLRANTPQGERVSLARSEEIYAGASITFNIVMFRDDDEDVVREWLDFGRYNGLLQWRNSGHGRFTWEEVE